MTVSAPITKRRSVPENSLKLYAAILIFLNILSIISGVIFLINPLFLPLHGLLGVILLLTWAGNALLIWLNSFWESGDDVGAKRIDLLGTLYLVMVIFATVGMFAGNLTISSSFSEAFRDNATCYLLLYFSYFGTFGLGLAVALLSRNRSFIPPGAGRVKGAPAGFAGNLARFTAKAFLFTLLGLGFYLAYVLLGKGHLGREPLELFVSQLSLYMALFFSSVTVLLLKVYRHRRGDLLRKIIAAVGVMLCFIFLLPLGAMPFATARAKKDFNAAFGENWSDRIAPAAEANMLKTTLSLPTYFLGYPSGDYRVIRDVLYYEGTQGVDEGISLYFDAYLPPVGDAVPPGKNAVLIRIHGGGWVEGDKGSYNMMQVNKYFAARGYSVFDLQYGLSTLRGENKGAPEHVTGPFIADDMIRHLGLFTQYLEAHAADYGADLDAVFISGASAGGHLATALSLAMSSNAYLQAVSPALTVRGVIPFYPGNKHDILQNIGGSPEWLDVELLVDKDSPPCLIYQGTHDGLVPPWVSYSYRDTCTAAGAVPCAVLLMPFAGHASDFGFTGYYNQLFLYYMERFMALYRQSL